MEKVPLKILSEFISGLNGMSNGMDIVCEGFNFIIGILSNWTSPVI